MKEKNYCENLKHLLSTEWVAGDIRYFAETDSTNLQARLAAEDGAPHGLLFVAESQTAGRGRRGRNWSSEAEGNLYFSLLLKPDFGAQIASMVTLVMGLAVAETIRECCNADARIKWPNDVVVNGKKVCGILTELGLKGTAIDYLVVGVGINVGQREFAPEIADTATGLAAECGEEVNREVLLASVLYRFESLYEAFVRRGGLQELRERYDALLINRNREVRVLDPKEEYTGMARGITDVGELLVERPDGTVEKVFAGEVSVRGIYGYV